MKKSVFFTGILALALVCSSVLAGCGKKYAIGDTGPGGGIIFYVSQAGFKSNGVTCHYLEAAPADMSEELKWASGGFTETSIPAAQQTGIGAGAANTAAILEVDPGAPAAKACADYTSGDKSDWFLPSKDELALMYDQRATIGGFDSWYRSSSEANNRTAWNQGFSDGNQIIYGKNNGRRVRAVRAF
ncbi:MAG: DUF1566 domain-containing protein [Treponema sp.]|jgi:hypothetical protein|nr:DUF1566 domain-containing protein [Treponema sp.]